jgi:hypothetical protein
MHKRFSVKSFGMFAKYREMQHSQTRRKMMQLLNCYPLTSAGSQKLSVPR